MPFHYLTKNWNIKELAYLGVNPDDVIDSTMKVNIQQIYGTSLLSPAWSTVLVDPAFVSVLCVLVNSPLTHGREGAVFLTTAKYQMQPSNLMEMEWEVWMDGREHVSTTGNTTQSTLLSWGRVRWNVLFTIYSLYMMNHARVWEGGHRSHAELLNQFIAVLQRQHQTAGKAVHDMIPYESDHQSHKSAHDSLIVLRMTRDWLMKCSKVKTGETLSRAEVQV